MSKYLFDTNACIAIRNSFRGVQSADATRRQAMQRLIARWQSMAADELAMSFVSLGELAVWAERHSQPAHAHALLQRLQARCRCWALLLAQGLGVPRP